MEISEAAGGGWKTLTTMPHSDRLDFSVIEKYWHLEATSTPDNENKNHARIIHLEGQQRFILSAISMILTGFYIGAVWTQRSVISCKNNTLPLN